MKKEALNKLLSYTKSRKIIRLVFLYNNQDILEKLINIYEKLYNSNRTDSEKSELVLLYIKNRKRKNIEYLVCSSIILNTYSFNMQKQKIKEYLSNEESYEKIINECYIKTMSENINEEDREFEVPSKKKHKKDKNVIKSSVLITQNEHDLKYRTNNEIYNLIKIYYSDSTGKLINLIVNRNILEYRNSYEQLKLLKVYMDHPDKNVFNLIINEKLLKHMDLYEQLKIIDLYLINNNTINYNKITTLINLNYSFDEIEQEVKKDFENNIKIYKNK